MFQDSVTLHSILERIYSEPQRDGLFAECIGKDGLPSILTKLNSQPQITIFEP